MNVQENAQKFFGVTEVDFITVLSSNKQMHEA